MLLNTQRTILQSVIRRNYNPKKPYANNKYRPIMPLTPGALKVMQKTRATKRERMSRTVPSNVYFQGMKLIHSQPLMTLEIDTFNIKLLFAVSH